MELKKGDLHDLASKAWALHDMITEEIDKTAAYSLCRLCSENGLSCGIADTPFPERQGLLAIRDSLKDVLDSLLLLQKLRHWQPKYEVEAVARLEESRLVLVKQVIQYHGRSLDVVRELNTCFNDGKTAFDWNLLTHQITSTKKVNSNVNQVGEKGKPRFWTLCLRVLINPRGWHRAVGAAAKLAVIFASVSSTLSIRNAKQQKRFTSSHQAFVPLVGSRDDMYVSKGSPLDVFRGRG